jgi:hypothetical protein
MNVLDIIRKAIDDAGADGLCDPEMECGCTKDDLAPCGSIGHECVLARKRKDLGSIFLPEYGYEMIPLTPEEKPR